MRSSALGSFATRHGLVIAFLCVALCLAGAYAALGMPSSIFPQTNFPRVVILIDNGVMPANEMMATITRPVEEAMKDIPGVRTVRSKTGRGSAEINVFFTWQTDMVQAELFVQGRLAVVQKTLPATASSAVWRLTFAAFPVIGLSLTGPAHSLTELWETAHYTIGPRLLRIPGVARTGIVGGRAPEYHVIVDPLRLQAVNLSLAQVTDALIRNNLIAPTGMLEEDYKLYLTVVDGRVHTVEDIENLTVSVTGNTPIAGAAQSVASGAHPIRIKDFARVERSQEPAFNIVTANGVNAVLLNVYSQPDGSTLDIAKQLKQELESLKKALPPGMQASVFYDQSLLVGDSIRSVWEAILLGLILSVVILYLFLKNWGATLIAAMVIPATVLITLLMLRIMGLGFNLMTLGGIAAAIGLIIDDAIVVVEAVHTKITAGEQRLAAVQQALTDIFRPLLASTLTPVVVFIPLAFLDGVAGCFFRALALTMVVSLLTSLVLAVTLIPSLAAWWMPTDRPSLSSAKANWLERLIQSYEKVLRTALEQAGKVLTGCMLILALGVWLYGRLESEFLPFMDEGGFVLDYRAPWGTSLAETDRQLRQAETLLRAMPELESYSRRTGARLALGISQAHMGDFLVKLKPDRQRKTDEIVADLRKQLHVAVPGIEWEFAGILNDLIGDLTWSPRPIEIKLFSTDVEWLKQKAPQVEAELKKIDGIVDTFDGLETTGPSLSLRVRDSDAQRFGLTVNDVSMAVGTAMLGQKASYVLEGDRVVNIRVRMNTDTTGQIANLRELPLRSLDGRTVKLSQVADVVTEPGQLELHREDLRQLVAVSARLENRDLGSTIAEIKAKLNRDQSLPPGVLEFGGLYQQQQESFHNLLVVLLASIFLVFTVLLVEFGSFYEAIAIVFGSVLALCGTVLAWYLTGTSVNIVALLGAIIGIGVVAKNGILMLDSVHRFESQGVTLENALVESGRRRLRPVLMTSLAAALGLLPLAYGIGAGSDMLKPLAIAVIGALTLSVLLSLVATPTVYFAMRRLGKNKLKGGATGSAKNA
ncbi:efflux RND transporter permease subunit [Methylobacter sp.]|uniref:efflux RND transporter permease subunit n=1 Tax=Methylobacter sp. TaxID=2051955 RepID=UPI002488C80F|nr:efflux RND transporter permease subunit [Methylobacter sp.]MDI1277262.1 efflux RND transporter permease subunit [Methylobacter sp.]MDI1357828.1 efflux RND transporter permease subunit [Methylobacter sp.]